MKLSELGSAFVVRSINLSMNLDLGLNMLRKNPSLGDHSEEVTPVPIPNTEVKSFSAYGTARVPWWESRSWPRIVYQLNSTIDEGASVF